MIKPGPVTKPLHENSQNKMVKNNKVVGGSNDSG